MVSLTVTCWIAEAIEWVHLHAIAAYLSCKNRQHSGQQNYKKARIMLIALKIYCTCQVVGYKSVLKFHVLGKRKPLASKFPRAQSNWASMGCAGPAIQSMEALPHNLQDMFSGLLNQMPKLDQMPPAAWNI